MNAIEINNSQIATMKRKEEGSNNIWNLNTTTIKQCTRSFHKRQQREALMHY